MSTPTPKDVTAIGATFADKHYKEGPNNDTMFGQWYGLNHEAWCAMFVSYCYWKAGVANLVAAESPKGFAGCVAGLRWFTNHKRIVPNTSAGIADLAFMNFDGGRTPQHVGLVMSNNLKLKQLHTIEGNTKDGVYYRTRPYSCVVAVAHPNWPH
jgi:hypothetical protein